MGSTIMSVKQLIRECIMNKENFQSRVFRFENRICFRFITFTHLFLSVKNYFYKMKDVPEGFS